MLSCSVPISFYILQTIVIKKKISLEAGLMDFMNILRKGTLSKDKIAPGKKWNLLFFANKGRKHAKKLFGQ